LKAVGGRRGFAGARCTARDYFGQYSRSLKHPSETRQPSLAILFFTLFIVL